MFRAADLVVLTKTDLLPVMDDFDPARAEAALRALGRETPMIRTAARRAPSLGPWLEWLEAELAAPRERVAQPLLRAPIMTVGEGLTDVPCRFQCGSWRCSRMSASRSRSEVFAAACPSRCRWRDVGDYVIVHAGFALARLDVVEAEKTLALFAEIAARLEGAAHALHPCIP